MLTVPITLALALSAMPAPPAREVALGQKMARPWIEPTPAPSTTTTSDEDDTPPVAQGGPGDENVLKTAKLGTSDDALIDFFKKRTPPAPEPAKVAALVASLSDKDEKTADAAQAALIAIGQPAMPKLRTAANNTDEPAGAARARFCMEQIDGANAANLVVNVARLLATRKPDGACEVLLGYLPYAEDDQTYAEVELALVSVAMKNGKPDQAILAALKNPLALIRASAAQVLATAGGSAYYKDVRPLLKDVKPSVRLKAALGLVGANDAEAIPVLIGLMGEPKSRMRNQAEKYLLGLAGEWSVSGPKGDDATSRRLRRQVWEGWWKGLEPEKISEDVKERTPTDEEAEKIEKAIAALGDSVAEVQNKASDDLIGFGKKATALLRRAAMRDPKISAAAIRCLEIIEKDTPSPLPLAAPRILALLRAKDTVSTLIGYLPYAETDEAAQQIVDALSSVAATGTKGDEALVKALGDANPARRAAAVTALCRAKATDEMPALKKALLDKDPLVRLRAAQGLAPMGDKKAVSTMIALLADLPIEQCWEVEDFLSKVAGDKAPALAVSMDKDSRTKAIEAWAKWWTENRSIDLTKLDLTVEREMGFLLVTESYNPQNGRGRVLEMDGNGKIRWQMDNLSAPYDAHLCRNGNVLVVENWNRVTERDRSGKIVGLDKYFNSVFYTERLRDGSTFVACRNQIQIVDGKGNVKFTHSYNQNSILAARTFRDGSMAYVSYSGHYVKLDKNGKEIKSYNLALFNFSMNGGQILPNDRVIMCFSNNMVREYNADGKMVWEATGITYPMIPYRLSNGNTLVTANSYQQIVEIDSRGKVIKTTTPKDVRPYRVSKR